MTKKMPLCLSKMCAYDSGLRRDDGRVSTTTSRMLKEDSGSRTPLRRSGEGEKSRFSAVSVKIFSDRHKTQRKGEASISTHERAKSTLAPYTEKAPKTGKIGRIFEFFDFSSVSGTNRAFTDH